MCDHPETIPIETLTAHPPETVPIVTVVGWRCIECGTTTPKEDE